MTEQQRMTKSCSKCGNSVPDSARACDACGHYGFHLDGAVCAATFTVTAEHYNGVGGLRTHAITLERRDDEGHVVDSAEYSVEIAGRALYLSRPGSRTYSMRIDLTALIEAWAAVPPLARPEGA